MFISAFAYEAEWNSPPGFIFFIGAEMFSKAIKNKTKTKKKMEKNLKASFRLHIS